MTDTKTTHFGSKTVSEGEKEQLVGQVFSSVAEKYDIMNTVMSMGIHHIWKRFMISKTGFKPGETAIDVGGGTADIAMLLRDSVGGNGKVVVYDINHAMLMSGKDKVVDHGIMKDIDFVQGNAEAISFPDNTFDVATVAFCIRNVTHPDQGFREMYRVLKPGGKLVCLEFSRPTNDAFRAIYDFYSFNFIPKFGEMIAKDRDSYQYLVESIRKFPPQEELKKMLEDIGLYKVKYYNLTNGIAAVHVGYKV